MRSPDRGAVPEWVAGVLGRQYGLVSEVVRGLTAEEFARPTRCAGLAVGPLLVHLLYDAQRALTAFASPSEQAPDRDFVSYWQDFPAREAGGEDPHAEFVRVVASAYREPPGLVRHWQDLSEAAVRAAMAADPKLRVATQGHVLRAQDFVATLVFEATVHHLDLTLELPQAPEPDPEALQVTARTLDGLFGPDAWDLIGWDTTTYVLKATGRLPLDDDDRDLLGAAADRLPLIG